MSKTEKLNEEQVFKQELDDEELNAVTGGDGDDNECKGGGVDISNCTDMWNRKKDEGIVIPNCAKNVEIERNCALSDACNTFAVVYSCNSGYYRD